MIGKVQVTSVPNGIQSPEPGMHVQVINLKSTQGMLINSLHLEERAVGAVGTLSGAVPGFGGDVWFVLHDEKYKTRYQQAYQLSELKQIKPKTVFYQVGPDEINNHEFNDVQLKFDWVVYFYELEDYEGSGQSVAYCKEEDLLYITSLSHHSGDGPMEDGFTPGNSTVCTPAQFRKVIESEEVPIGVPIVQKEISDKVIELLNKAD